MKKTKSLLILSLCAAGLGLVACGGSKPASVNETYFYKVSFNHMNGEAYGVNLTNELIRTESESLVLFSDNTFCLTFASSLIGTISGDDHETGYVYQEQMEEEAILTGKYSVKSNDELLKTKSFTLDSFTLFQHNNKEQSLDNSDGDTINFTLKAGAVVSVSTETNKLSSLVEWYEGQYVASNTSYAA